MIPRFIPTDSIGVMTRSSRARLVRSLGLTVILVSASLAAAAPAQATYGDPIGATFIGPTTPVEYGSYWDFTVNVSNTPCSLGDCEKSLEVSVIGDNGHRERFRTDVFDTDELDMARAYFGQYNLKNPLGAGAYTFTARFIDPYSGEATGVGPLTMASGNKAGKLTITPAKVAVDLRIETDEHQPTAAIAFAQLTGPFIQAIDGCYGSTDCHPDLSAGEWTFTIKDDIGATVQEKKIPVKGTATQFASFYWHDVPASSDFIVSASFTPIDGQKSNYDIEQATEVTFSSPAPPVIDESDPAVVVPVTEEPAAPSSVPLWLVILGLGLLVLLLIAVAIFFILLRRQSAPAVDDSVDSDEAGAPIEGDNA